MAQYNRVEYSNLTKQMIDETVEHVRYHFGMATDGPIDRDAQAKDIARRLDRFNQKMGE